MITSTIRDAADLKSFLIGEDIDLRVVDAFVASAKPPAAIRSDVSLGALVARAGSRPGEVKVTSARLMHWIVNWKVLLFDAVPSFATTATNPHLIIQILAVLKGLKALVDAGTVTLTKQEATIVAAIWADKRSIIPKNEIETRVGIDEKEFEVGIDGLLRLGIIDMKDDARLIKTEWMILV